MKKGEASTLPHVFWELVVLFFLTLTDETESKSPPRFTLNLDIGVLFDYPC